jgi:SAM-dependent methyltransferase
MRWIYTGLIDAWLPAGRSGFRMKTDLFEEAVSDQPVLPALGPLRLGIDISPDIARAARARTAAAAGRSGFVVCDLRALPFKAGTVEAILAGSSHDHFIDKADIAVALREAARILAPGGTLIITLDNPHNLLVWLRNALPFSWLNRVGLVPYFVGATYRRREARDNLAAVGLEVVEETAVLHVPRAPAIWSVHVAEMLGGGVLLDALDRLFQGCEALARWPTRFWTGYYLAYRARKPADTDAPTTR